MSLFKVSKTNQELAPSSGLETQSSVIEEENILNHPNIPQANNPEKDNLILETKDNDSLVKSYSRNKINLFYTKIKLIRKKYNIKKSRKNHIDSLIKKAKSKFLKAIYECLKYCLHSFNLCRLPQKFIINTRIEYNKKILNETVKEVYN